MNELSISAFQDAIQAVHGSQSRLAYRESVTETFRGEVAWEGKVLVFELLDHPTARRCYAWEVDGRVTAVLHEDPVDSPQAAVRAAIVAEHKETSSEDR